MKKAVKEFRDLVNMFRDLEPNKKEVIVLTQIVYDIKIALFRKMTLDEIDNNSLILSAYCPLCWKFGNLCLGCPLRGRTFPISCYAEWREMKNKLNYGTKEEFMEALVKLAERINLL